MNPPTDPQVDPSKVTPPKIVNVNIIKPPLWKQIISNPFRSYFKMGSITFGIVAVTNFVTFLGERHFEYGQKR